jgi:hypothetical protein
LALLKENRELLTVRSPIDGQVVTWNVHKTLSERPVAVGQVLITVADLNSSLELEMFVPEADVTHLIEAKRTQAAPLAIDYVIVTDPTQEHRGALRQVDTRAQLHESDEHCVRLLVDIDRPDVGRTPAGTSTTARINCGAKPIGYVWLRRVTGFIYSKVLFRIG